MKYLIPAIMMTVCGIGAWLFGNAIWILAIVNFLWLLVKNTTLFSWWWVIGSIFAFIFSIIGLIVARIIVD